jgi:hypothetical protein
MFCFVDHFEPFDLRRPMEENDRVMRAWSERYPALCAKHADSRGVPPQHTWFYPGEGYYPRYIEALSRLVERGLGEIELHLHHGNDTEESLRRQIEAAKANFARHGALVTASQNPRSAYAFIHGNSALCNSRHSSAWCGVNDELRVLQETGCFADFSFPTYPSESQPRKINCAYYATSSPHRPRGYDIGEDVQVGSRGNGHLMLIQGPLALNWRHRKYGVVPRVENGDITRDNPPTSVRLRLWLERGIRIKGRPNWGFVKVSCHGAQTRDLETLLGEPADRMYSELEALFRDRPGWQLHYVTAREMYNIVKGAEAGETGNPDLYRDYVIPPYQNRFPKRKEIKCVGSLES